MNSTWHFRVISGVFFFFGLVVIASAWGFEIIGGYEPCVLCLEQRTPYYVALPVALCGIFVSLYFQNQLYAKILLLLAGVAMVYGAGLGVYHAGVEWAFWEGPAECGGGSSIVESASDLKAALQNTRIISCSDASWRMFGLSFAGWNVIASIGLAIVALFGLRTIPDRNKE